MRRSRQVAPAALAVLGVLADAATTQVCFSLIPGCTEGNPVSARLFELLGGLWPTAILLCLLLIAVSWPLWRRHSMSPVVTAVAWLSLAVFSVLRWNVVLTNVQVWPQA